MRTVLDNLSDCFNEKHCPSLSALVFLHPCRIFAVRFLKEIPAWLAWFAIRRSTAVPPARSWPSDVSPDGNLAGNALGYRRGAKGGTWIAKFRDPSGKRHLESLGAADDAATQTASARSLSRKRKSGRALGSSAR
jgi:hypothetical protein